MLARCPDGRRRRRHVDVRPRVPVPALPASLVRRAASCERLGGVFHGESDVLVFRFGVAELARPTALPSERKTLG